MDLTTLLVPVATIAIGVFVMERINKMLGVYWLVVAIAASMFFGLGFAASDFLRAVRGIVC